MPSPSRPNLTCDYHGKTVADIIFLYLEMVHLKCVLDFFSAYSKQSRNVKQAANVGQQEVE